MRKFDEALRRTEEETIQTSETTARLRSSAERRPTSPTRGPRRPSKCTVLLRLLDEPPPVDGVETLSATEKTLWRTVIVTDEIFRSLIIESTTVEEYVRISRDIRYERLFERTTWDTIIRILTHPSVTSLPFGTEEDFHRDWSEITYRFRPERIPMADPTGSNRSSWNPDYDLRSITEEDVNFTRLRRDAPWSDAGGQVMTTMTTASNDVPINVSSSSYQVYRVGERSTRAVVDVSSSIRSTNIREQR